MHTNQLNIFEIENKKCRSVLSE